MTAPDGDGALAELRNQARELVGELTGPVRRLHLRRGEAELEIEWHGPPAAAGAPDVPGTWPGAAAGAVPAARRGPGGPGPADGPPAGPTAARPAGPATGTAQPAVLAVLAPMVGTFYRAPEPGRPPFVEVGDVVQPDRVVGIVEAMKLMNEVTAGQAGRVVDLLVADGQPVEYGQPLIVLAPIR
ncbi:acetyl-CoA carboxylase biotin carboxyl carrier protein [Plantactinospora sp. KBS50]|uniref:acetyl-CoA carboxylase biotin carboxyl carrier protein n=1 Tax=Plantactinospora sp. KBS50 TaxID=2024580 RepID=UPI000BAAB5DC|nr:acetyl-CoA carboxylase biotin carboxyl carrier protein [Plantactinospora sp. KBS50]ASW55186.1 acetyl-CoA carboxylase, biotin carboxyl carrier protein [Plantactinospora sp. KBS50]